ncbi:MAG: protease modulator HflC [Kordiimonadaceae bacterium]|nr:protease modulator HflC [Kordiimonadaceae bacterium]
MSKSLSFLVAGLVAAVVLLTSSMYVVDEREQALVFQLGKLQDQKTEAGLYFKLPFVQQITFLEKRIMSMDNPPTEAIEVDKKRLLLDGFTRFRIIDPLKRYQAARDDRIAESLLAQAVNSAIKEVIATEKMAVIVSGDRAELMERVRVIADGKAFEYGMSVVDVRLKRVDLPSENSQAIFLRMETERQREAAEERAVGRRDAVKIKADADRQAAVIIAESEKLSQIIRGEADGRAVKLFADAYGKDVEFFEFYRTMEAYRKSMNRNDTTMVMSPDSEFLKMFVNSKK